MADIQPLIHSFNAGEISKAALNRVDLERTRLNAEIQENLFPYAIGKALMRPGTQLLGRSLNGTSRLLPFAKTLDAKAVLELGVNASAQGKLRVWIDGALIVRPSVSATVTNGSFSSSSGWTSTLTGDASAGFSSSGLQLVAPGRGSKASVTQSVATTSSGIQHALDIVVAHGPVHFRCGSAIHLEDYISDTVLDAGMHSLAFTPTGASFWVEFYTKTTYSVQVTSIAVASAGTMEVDAPWGQTELRNIRYDASLDVVFLSRDGEPQYKIERRGNESWSVSRYQSDDGPFTIARTADITLQPGATFGNTTLTASEAFFQSTHAGALFRLSHEGSVITCGLSALDEHTENIRVIGIHGAADNHERQFTVAVTGTWSGVLTVERSFDGPDSGFKAYGSTIIGNGTTTPTEDQDDNAIVYYRVRMTTYTSGTAYVTLTYAGDGGTGIVRIVSVDSSTLANVEVLTDLRNVSATKNWLEGEWSDKRGYPTAVSFFDGRLFWPRSDRFWGSVSGDYYGFSLDVVGDSGSIQRDIATGGNLATVNWLLPLQRLIFGTSGETVSARTSAFDEPLTPTNITLKAASTQGASPVTPLKIDARGVYVQRSTTRLYELLYDIESGDYRASSLVRQHETLGQSAAPDLFDDGFVELALQRQPETYIWAVREDGQVPIMIYEPDEKVAGWIRFRTGYIAGVGAGDDRVLSLAVLPSEGEDEVYLEVERNLTQASYAQNWLFQDSNNSFTTTNATLSTGADYSTLVATGSDPQVRSASLSFSGSANTVIVLDFEVVTAGTTWQGDIFYQTSGHGESASFHKTFAEPAAGTRVKYEIDMASLTAGGTDWVSNTITRIRVDFYNDAAGQVRIYSIKIRAASGIAGKAYCVEKLGAHGQALTRYGGSDVQNGLYMMDSYITATADGTAAQLIAGLDHLCGNAVMAVGCKAGKTYYSPSASSFTVDLDGYVTLNEAFEAGTILCIGRPYEGRYLSSKLAYGGKKGTAKGLKKKIDGVSLEMLPSHWNAIRLGRDLGPLIDSFAFLTEDEEMDELPRIKEDGSPVDPDAVFDADIDESLFAFPGEWGADPRLAIRVRPGYSATLSALVIDIDVADT